MINIVARAGALSPYLKTSTQVVASGLKPIERAIPVASTKLVAPPGQQKLTSKSLNQALTSGKFGIKSGVGVSTQLVRYAHTDIQIPDFSDYRRKDTRDPSGSNRASADKRKNFTYMIVGGTSVASAYAAKAVVTQFVSSMAASADVLAMAKIEIKLGDIPEGKSVTFKWRGKPLFIRHRTGKEIDTENAVPLSSLRDAQTDAERVQKAEWLIVIGVCTHLGCVPIANAGDYGGYYCPCHGSHYDASGRIRKGPAPLNLEVPTYSFPEEGMLLVG